MTANKAKTFYAVTRKKLDLHRFLGELNKAQNKKQAHLTMQDNQQFEVSFSNSGQTLKPVSSTSQEEISVMQLFHISSIDMHSFLSLPSSILSIWSLRRNRKNMFYSRLPLNKYLILCQKPPSKISQPATELG